MQIIEQSRKILPQGIVTNLWVNGTPAIITDVFFERNKVVFSYEAEE